jgi:hypothetical protein
VSRGSADVFLTESVIFPRRAQGPFGEPCRPVRGSNDPRGATHDGGVMELPRGP